MIEQAGGRALHLPLFGIGPLEPDTALQNAAARLNEFEMAVFVSPNAVEHALPELLRQTPWPAGLRVFAPGQGTAKALAGFGVINTLYPAGRQDSEALLDLPEMQQEQVRGRRMVIFCGETGRPLLFEQLAARGAQVERIACYRRVPKVDVADRLCALGRSGEVDGLVITSSESLRWLHSRQYPADQGDFSDIFSGIPLFVSHARIAEFAQSIGIRHIVHATADDTGVLAALCAYNWP